MKVLGVFLFMTALVSLLTVSLDVLLGFTPSAAFMHLIDPFLIMGLGEYLMVLLFLFITIGNQIMIRKK